MIALVLAAAVAAPPPPSSPVAEPMPNRYSQPARCGAVVRDEVQRQMIAFKGQIPVAQYAVLRSIDGCAVPSPVGYHPNYVSPGAADPTSKPEDGRSRRR